MAEQLTPYPPEFGQRITKNFDVLTPEKFRQDFCNAIDRAVAESPNRAYNLSLPVLQRPSIGVEAMWIEFYNKDPRAIFDSLLKAAKAGFNVDIHRDWFSDTQLDENLLFLPPTLLARKAEKLHRQWVHGFSQKRLDLLEDAGAKIIPTNIPAHLAEKATYLFRGRNHKKIMFVKGPKGATAWIGGMNLAQEHFRELDFMVKIDDPRIVEPLVEEFDRTGDKKRTRNADIQVTKDTAILVDTGKSLSHILKRAVRDVDNAKEFVYVSSAFLPSGEFLEALDRVKKRGVHVAYITCNPKKTGGLLGFQGKLSDARNKRKDKIPVISPKDLLVHAKALVVDGKSAIIGSHNFVDMPHEELSIRSENKELIQNVTEFLQRISGGNLDRHLESDLVVANPIAAE